MHVYRGLALWSIAPVLQGCPTHVLGQYDARDSFFFPNCRTDCGSSAQDMPSVWFTASTMLLHLAASSHRWTFATSAASTVQVPPFWQGLELQLPMAHVLPVQPGSHEHRNASVFNAPFESKESVQVPWRHGDS